MSKLHNFFGAASNIDEGGENRPSRNDYGYQLLEKIEVNQLMPLLNELSAAELRTVTDLLHIRSISSGRVSTKQTRLIQTTAIRLFSSGSTRALSRILTKNLEIRSRELLGNHFDNPTAKQIKELSDSLIIEFGPLKTKWFYGCAIDDSAHPTPHLLRELSARSELAIDLYVHNDSPLEFPESRPAPTEQIRISRRERRQQDKIERALRRSQESEMRLAQKQRTESKKKLRDIENQHLDEAGTDSPEPIKITKLQHRHLTRFLKATTDHPEVGTVKWGFIAFRKDDPDEGKDRPFVIVAVAPRYYIVRPIYSQASRYAGVWRAVDLHDWKIAGLPHESVVGHKTQKITRDKIRGHIGELSISDWNRICRGEVNTKYDS